MNLFLSAQVCQIFHILMGFQYLPEVFGALSICHTFSMPFLFSSFFAMSVLIDINWASLGTIDFSDLGVYEKRF